MNLASRGNGDLTHEEAKTHFTAWALMKSPLLIGTSVSRLRTCAIVRELNLLYLQLSSIGDSDLSILRNEEVIAINQDPVVGTSVTPFRWGINVCLMTTRWITILG